MIKSAHHKQDDDADGATPPPADEYIAPVPRISVQAFCESETTFDIVKAAGLVSDLNSMHSFTVFANNFEYTDAVLRGPKIWEGEWRQQRAASNKVREDQLEEVYRQRSMLKLSVFPEDIAEGVYFFASDFSAKSTGNILNIDAGNAQAFTR